MVMHRNQGDFAMAIEPTRWTSADAEVLDTETASLLRAHLLPVVERAGNWPELRRGMAEKGFRLVFEGDELVICDAISGKTVCSMGFLGHSVASLTARFGRARVLLPCNGRRRPALDG
ncbi:MAG: hypothetical protein D6688_14425 [Alphaproteobacteria bacterium]|nr:MAG: hypothetical protein D6688_14425 [Alphaproteobacteria bacterium]